MAMAFWHGCNYPWSTDGTTVFYGLDFGVNIWGSHLGVSTRLDAVERDFASMAGLGFTVVRWFVFCDGRSGIVFDEWGFASGLDSHFFVDLDAALETARRAGIRVVLVLLDHRWMFDSLRDLIPDAVSGAVVEVRLRDGRAGALRSAAARDALFDTVIEPLVRRYGRTGVRSDLAGSIAAFELMNEPDFVIEEWERDLSRHVASPLPFAALGEAVARLSAIVHEYSPAAATIGAARLHNLWAWDDDALGLDVLQVHSYPDLRAPNRDADIFGRPASSLGVRRPVVLGEFAANGPAQHPDGVVPPERTMDEYLAFAVAGGYLGAWPWSYSGTDAYGRFPDDALRQFAAAHPQLVNPRAHL